MARGDAPLIKAVVQHIVLPPQLPDSFDGDDLALICEFGQRLQNALHIFHTTEDEPIWNTLKASLQATNEAVQANQDSLDRDTLLKQFRLVKDSDRSLWLGLHLAPQNAGLIIHCDSLKQGVVFEAFQAAAPVSEVLNAKGALTCDYPTRAAVISLSDFGSDSFLENLSEFLDQASSESFDRFAARASKKGKSVVETRDCPSPALIIEMLMSLIEGLGGSVQISQLRKRVRDDVVLGGSEIPWRRSPHWLVLRVTIGRLLFTYFENTHKDMGRVFYKFIICAVLANLLGDSVGSVHPELTLMLQAKLCRRLDKLERERSAASGALRIAYDDLFARSKDHFGTIISQVGCQVNNLWNKHKKAIIRQIPILPTRAPKGDLELHLKNSHKALRRLLSSNLHNPRRPQRSPDVPSLEEGTVSQVTRLAARYKSLIEYETKAMAKLDTPSASPEQTCVQLSTSISDYLEKAGHAYTNAALPMSRYLLKLFELWVGMDTAATAKCPLLKRYHPGFSPSSLDVLCLLTLDEMKRLQQVQKYICTRVDSAADKETIFSTPMDSTSFALNFVHSTELADDMISLGGKIDACSTRFKEKKERELMKLMQEYDDLTESIQDRTCTCTYMSDGSKDIRGCKKCYDRRCRKRLSITIHEDFLPSTETIPKKAQRAAILFELRIPEYLAAYRFATWKIRALSRQSNVNLRNQPKLLLKDMQQLKSYLRKLSTPFDAVTLASYKKSFSQTHYGKLKLPKMLDEVVFPMGAEFEYYDCSSGLWACQIPEIPWFQHLLGSWIPKGISDPYASAERFSPDEEFHPSSYEIAVNGPSCPPNTSIHEFSALQRAVSGRARRWLVLLVELGTTNMDLSSESTAALFNHLALQAGPSIRECGVLREAHGVFRDHAFCERLCEQIHRRLRTLASSWRECHYMSMLVIFSLKLLHLCPQDFRLKAEELLVTIRSTISRWITHLRSEVRSTSDEKTSRTASNFAFWAALLCRQTYSVYLHFERRPSLDDVQIFFQASIAVQENLVVDLKELSPNVKHLFNSDLYTSYLMRSIIESWFMEHGSLLEKAINDTWTDTGNSSGRQYSQWKPLSNFWVTSQIDGTQWTASQVIHYHLLQGHLLVDGKPLGKLPLQMTQDPCIQELFKGQHLLTRPSSILEYQLVSDVERHQIHFGFRGGRVVVRAVFHNSHLEHVPREVFGKTPDRDLPSMLIDDCVHWINLQTGQLEIRQKPRIWKSRPNNWILNVRDRTAMRNKRTSARCDRSRPGVSLVEPRSQIGRQIATIFDGFEDDSRLTIFQPVGKSSLSVEMKRLEILFSVNEKGLLQCPQLRAEVDPHQDIGTFHGLSSQVILRDIKNPDRKSIIVPIGDITWGREGIHVSIRIENSGLYAKFTVDPLLGRLDCPPEPRLLYFKAALHALTSFPLPDSLTLRTGTEEARHCLLSACSQPWDRLRDDSYAVLSMIKSLSPKRSYYPPGIELYQKVKWSSGLTMSIQHEELALLADAIRLQSEKLAVFHKKVIATEMTDNASFQEASLDHLSFRGRIRRQVYERVCFPSDSEVLQLSAKISIWKPTNNYWDGKESCRVYQTVRALQAGMKATCQLSNLLPLMEGRPAIEGFVERLININVAKLLNADIMQTWASYVFTLRHAVEMKTYDDYFLLAILAFGRKTDMGIIRWLVALSKNPRLREIEAPQHLSYVKFHRSEEPSKDTFESLILAKQPRYGETLSEEIQARRGIKISPDQYQQRQRAAANQVSSAIVNKLPKVPNSIDAFTSMVENWALEYTNLEMAWECLAPELQRLIQNSHFSAYLSEIEMVASDLYSSQSAAISDRQDRLWDLKPRRPTTASANFHVATYNSTSLTDDLMRKTYANEGAGPAAERVQGNGLAAATSSEALLGGVVSSASVPLPKHLSMLNGIINRFISSSKTEIRQQYGQDLQNSLQALIQSYSESFKPENVSRIEKIDYEIGLTRQAMHKQEHSIRKSLEDRMESFQWLSSGNLWPCLSPIVLLEQLRDPNSVQLAPGMKEALVAYGVCITRLQQLLRVKDSILRNEDKGLREDQEHLGHSNWEPYDHPEWLLLEIDNNFLIRPSQIDVARAIISPPSASNSVLQMNMGQGKTSCIIPMAVTALADKDRLCRVVVPRSLLLQTAQVMQSRIGGLVGRAVRHIPFFRRSPSRMSSLDLFHGIHNSTLESGGIMLCLPEHILSFKLSGLQQLMNGESKRAKRAIEIQRWLETSCRDVLDESDFTLSVRTQLIYPSGIPTAVDGHPQRWQVIEEVLSLVENHVPHLQERFGNGIEIVRRHQGYPILHFLRTEVEDGLNALLVRDICEGRLLQVQFKHETNETAQRNVGLIVSGVDVDSSIWEETAESLMDDVFGLKTLHLLRGLISQRVLIQCLKKRWNVQYGLHPERVPIAVPFEAKGVPSPTAEYGHPDTALVLTCLAFYQTGLTKSQMTQNLQHVLRSDDPTAQYDRLVHGCKLPARLEHWNIINTDDEAQIEEIWGYLRFDRHVLNYYLNNFAFPQHAKQFRVKLQASGWDIPLLSKTTSSTNLTTGFSGTNDNKRILPKTIQQEDLPSLEQTNAEVLSYLLEPRNQTCYQSVDKNGRHLSEIGLLELLQSKRIRILIDAGSHILEMENEDLAAAWLDVCPEAQGAVYLDRDSRIRVRARFQKTSLPLLASPFAENLEKCVVYIDEAHTRGTDLKLPIHAKGAVTLGLDQTKDQVVQAAMRLRRLGSTQSVAFIVPPEVNRSILDLRAGHANDEEAISPIESSDVTYWLLEQSCKANENLMSLHAAQGFDFCRRTNALWKYSNLNDKKQMIQLLSAIQDREDQTLEQLYRPRQSTLAVNLDFSSLEEFAAKLRRQNAESATGNSSAFEEVEQEREVEFEVEQIREKEKPLKMETFSFPGLDPSIVRFVETGELDGSDSFIQAFRFLGSTKVGRQFGIAKTSSRLFVSKEFSRVVRDAHSGISDNVVRPVEWILWSTKSETALVIIPEEVELLIPILRDGKRSRVRLLTYAAPVTKSMNMFNSLIYYTISTADAQKSFPTWLSIEIGILAGRLYFDWSEYRPLLAWLGIDREAEFSTEKSTQSSQAPKKANQVRRGMFVREPLKFLLEWLTLRRQTLDILHTPMGYICQKKCLRETHSFFVSATAPDESNLLDFRMHTEGMTKGSADEGSDDDSDWGDDDEGLE